MSEAGETWVDWLLSTPRGSIFVRVDDAYLGKAFNFYGVRQKVPNFGQCLSVIRGPRVSREQLGYDFPDNIDEYGLCLYGLVHARFLLTAAGQELVRAKFQSGGFCRCPRACCGGAAGVPVGLSDELGVSNVKLFCVNCQDVYSVVDERFTGMDGAFFGPSWAHLFVRRFPEVVPSEPPRRYVPRIFGFRVAAPGTRGP